MPLSIQDKLALLMTSARTMTNAGLLIGVSRQTVRRMLLGERVPDARKPRDLPLIDSINYAFDLHRKESRRIAKAHGLPYLTETPVNLHRLQMKTGALGDRVAIDATHWISNELRDRIIAALHSTNFFLSASIRSMVNLAVYNKVADERIKAQRIKRTALQQLYKEQIKIRLEIGDKRSPIYTPLQDIRRSGPIQLILENINRSLRQRHEPATGDSGTALADQFLFQVMPPSVNANQSTSRKKARSRRR